MFVSLLILCFSVPQFATVYKARDKTNNTIVAIKKVTSQQYITSHFLFLLVM